MARMRHPHLGSVVDVRPEDVKRYAEAGYQAERKPEPTKTAERKPAAKK